MPHRKHLPPPEGTDPKLIAWLREDIGFVIHNVFVKYRRQALVGYLFLLIGVSVALINQHDTSTAQHNETLARRAQATDQRHAIVQSGRTVAVEGCNRDFKTITGLRGILISSQSILKQNYKNGLMNRKQYTQATGFYDDQLKKLALPDCRIAREVVTDNPDMTTQIPVPLHP